MSESESWRCGGCLTWYAPHRDNCGCESGGAATTATDRSESPQPVVAGKRAVASKTSTTKNGYDYKDPAFLRFWEVYPLKREKAEAYRRWQQVTAAGVSPDRIITAAAAYAVDPTRDPAFTKYPSGWLARGRWDDEVAPMSHPLAAVAEVDFDAEQDARRAAEDVAIANFDLPEDELHAMVNGIGGEA